MELMELDDLLTDHAYEMKLVAFIGCAFGTEPRWSWTAFELPLLGTLYSSCFCFVNYHV